MSARIVGQGVVRLESPRLGGATFTLHQVRLMNELWAEKVGEIPADIRLMADMLEASK